MGVLMVATTEKVAGKRLLPMVELASVAALKVRLIWVEATASMTVVVLPGVELASEVGAAGELPEQEMEQWIAHCEDSEVEWSAR